MRVLNAIFILIFFFASESIIFSQVCKNFNQSAFCIIPESYDYNQYEKSRSSYVLIRKINKYEIVLNDNCDYKISFCTPQDYDPIQFRIIEKESEKEVYDNSIENNVNYVGFSVDGKPLTILIEVVVLAIKHKPKNNIDIGTCLGIKIVYKKLTKTDNQDNSGSNGFSK